MGTIRYDSLEAMVKAGLAPRTVQDAFNLGARGVRPVIVRGDVARCGSNIFKVHPVTGKEQDEFLNVFKPTPTPADMVQAQNALERGKFDAPAKRHDGFLDSILGAISLNVFTGDWGNK